MPSSRCGWSFRETGAVFLKEELPLLQENHGALCVCVLHLPFDSFYDSLWGALGFLKAIKPQIFRAQSRFGSKPLK